MLMFRVLFLISSIVTSSLSKELDHLSNNDLILSGKWEKDNRINVYFLNQEYFKF